MERSRRTVLASLPVLLAGCGRSFRENSVPGGLYLVNRRQQSVTVTIRAARLPPRGTDTGTRPTETPETPPAAAVDPPDVTGEYEVRPGQERGVPDFFPDPGHWAVEAVVGDVTANRTSIELYSAIPGPTGADTVRIWVTPGDVTADATTVD